METRLFAMSVAKPRDLLRARQRTRQVAGLLGFDPSSQAALAAEVFARLLHGSEVRRGSGIAFLAADGCLQIEMFGMRFSTLLPERLTHAVEDVAWMMRELDRGVPFRAMDEVDKQNRELLAAGQPQPLRSVAGLRRNDSAA